MVAVIAGGGRVGSYLAKRLAEKGHRVVIIERRPEVLERLRTEVDAEIVEGDATAPEAFERTGVANADLVAAVTGDDEDNLVVCQLAKKTWGVPRVIARVNHPANKWLYTREWGVDVAVSAVHVIATIIEEEMALGDVITLLKLKEGQIVLTEFMLSAGSPFVNKRIDQLGLPVDTVLVAIIREEKVAVPRADTILEVGDQVLAITTPEQEKALAQMKEARSGS
ncbi:MAG: potassium channel family protein [Candidatus Aquicultorales bacterium]